MYDHFAAVPQPDVQPLATLLDVTLRDGGFEVDFRWPQAQFAAVTAALQPLGVEIVELGYLGGVPLDHGVLAPGIGANLTPNIVTFAAQDGLRLAGMIHTSALTDPPNLKAFAAAGLDLVRLVYHPLWRDHIQRTADEAHTAGLEVSINIALASRYPANELFEHATQIHRDMAPDVLYVADTCGALLPEQVTVLVDELTKITPTVGFHAHDFLGLGYANALAAAAAGATYLDTSILGLGRGGGNLAVEPVLIRHRLPHGHPSVADLRRFLDCRTGLAGLAGRDAPALTPAVCGAGNFTPVEEHDLLTFAAEHDVSADLAALWVAASGRKAVSRRRSDLADAWTAGGSR